VGAAKLYLPLQPKIEDMNKNKAKYWILISVVILLLASLTFAWRNLIFEADPLYIAVSGPMTGSSEANGKAMVQGIQFYLDQINQQGGIHNRPVKLLIFDDQNKPERAKEIALKITNNSSAVAVIGHYTSAASMAAAPIYQKYGIPAISGSATVDELTKGNDWYFRTIFNNNDQGALLANYARKILDYHYVDIIFDEDVYGTTLTKAFIQTAEFIGLKIRHRWHFKKDSTDFQTTLEEMIATLRQDSPTRKNLIFFATHSNQAIEAIVTLRKQGIGKNVKFLGGDALSSNNFIKKLATYPRERAQPGYYSNDTYVMTSFLSELADRKVQRFRHQFTQKYQAKPTVTSALYYDATKVLIDGLNRLETITTLKQTRQQIKDNLWQLSRMEDAVAGLTGSLFFDENGDATNSLTVGVYKKGQPIAAAYQYQLLSSVQNQDEMLQQVLNKQIIQSNGQLMNRARVVYVGIDFNEISELDFGDSLYTADFFLWFRFKGDFDDRNIEFVNALNPDTSLEKLIIQQSFSGDDLSLMPNSGSSTNPIVEQFHNDLTVRSYRVKTTFKAEFQFHDYPLDIQILPILFRHQELARDQLIYVVDTQGMKLRQFEPENIESTTRQFFKLGGWFVNDMLFFQNAYQNDSTLGMPNLFDEQQRIIFSQFNVAISIERYVSSFIIKTMLPVVFLIVLGYISFFIRAFAKKLAIGTNLIIATSLFHLKLSSDLSNVGYIILMEYFFYLVYFLAICIILVALFYHFNEDTEDEEIKKQLRRVNVWGRIVYPIILFTGIGVIVYTA
jgi:branched-chain amino acid transport system substrate-binding protein